MFEKIEKFVSCVCVSVMAILVFVNVVSRFAFKHSMAVSDEMSTYLFVLMSFMGTAIAAREGHPISWGRYCKYSAPAAVIVVAISMAVILLRY